jgi:hypothetical protein
MAAPVGRAAQLGDAARTRDGRSPRGRNPKVKKVLLTAALSEARAAHFCVLTL